jgi:hypothetical protein
MKSVTGVNLIIPTKLVKIKFEIFKFVLSLDDYRKRTPVLASFSEGELTASTSGSMMSLL